MSNFFASGSRLGGRERISGGPPGAPVHSYDAMYRDIVPDLREQGMGTLLDALGAELRDAPRKT